ncbi:LamG domain-containing protein [Winogradskyella immobilis]|uniref:LamG domain-containing protein n=1 Tax=Winogradskyella immobilis TaxID=2816852 RepID=A0ABS8EPD4_9FLAO|nr:LamG domain-containing protein [Winogradskyella immobilis]MCC1485074.1 LamG domain-containing protein [Winogradskyella immobilis]MCG0017166.1 LamG domain-containing protein [Winogradskyella immobilis]
MKHYILCVLVLSLAFTSCKEKTKEIETTVEDKQLSAIDSSLKSALTLYASFDNGVNADFALGDSKLYTVSNRKALDSAVVGLHKEGVSLVEGKGRYGNGLQYADKTKGYIYYPSLNNIAYSKTDWSSSISFWLSLDPNTDLKPGFCDPIQITDSGYNDAGIWVDFTKDNPRDFRLGVIEDRVAWNPNPEGSDNENENFYKMLYAVKSPPFAKDKWTHVVINLSGLNSEHGKAELYMNGELKGSRENISNPFTWEIEKSNIFLGLSYIGLMDDLSIYNKALSADEITALYSLENGVQTLLN